MKTRTASTSTWIPLAAAVLVLLGLADFYARTTGEIRSSARVLLEGSFWEGRDARGRRLWKKGRGAPRLEPGESIRLFGGDGEGMLLRSFAFTGSRSAWAAGLHLTFTQGKKNALILRLAPAARGGAVLALRGPNGRVRTVARYANQEPLPPPRRSFTVKLENQINGFSLKVDGEEIFKTTAVLRSAGSLTLAPEGGAWILHRLAVDGAKRSGNKRFTRCRYVERFRNLHQEPVTGALLRLRVHMLLLAAGLLAFLRALCPGGVPLSSLLRGAVYVLLPPVLCLEGVAILDLPSILPVLAAFLAAGLAWARRGLGDAGRRLLPSTRTGGAAALLAAAGTLALAAWDAGAPAVQRYGPATAAEQAAIRRPSASPAFRLQKARRLPPGEDLPAKGFFRNADVKIRAVLESGALLRVHLRLPRPDRGLDLFFLLSTDPSKPSGFYLEEGADTVRLGTNAGVFEAGIPLVLDLSARGRDFSARVNGRPVARARCRYLPAGVVVLHAEGGAARVERLEVIPRKHRERFVTTFPDFVLWAAGPVVFLFFAASLLSVLSTIPFLRAFAGTAFVLFPVGCGLASVSFGDARSPATAWTAILCAAVLFVAFLRAHRDRLSPVTWLLLSAVLLLGAAWAGAGLGLWAGPAWM